jgi:hemolysin III
MTEINVTSEPRQSTGEEIANSISHGIGLLVAIAAGPFVVARAVENGKPWGVVGASVFVAATTALYLASTLYHAWPQGRCKRILLSLEHCAIFVLIAGTYTPITLIAIRGTWGWTLFGIVWSLAAIGMLFKTVVTTKFAWLPGVLYLGLGWLIAVAMGPLSQSMSYAGLMWLLAGGIFYTLGMPFFAAAQVPYFHFVWHLFVMGGTTCHVVTVWFYVV